MLFPTILFTHTWNQIESLILETTKYFFLLHGTHIVFEISNAAEAQLRRLFQDIKRL